MKLLVLLLVTIVSIPCAYSQALPASSPEAQGFSSERLKVLDENVQKWIDQHWMQGAVVLISRNGKTIHQKAYGYDNAETKTPVKTNQLFRLASQTKAVTSVGIMQLYEAGKLMLDDSVAKYIPEFANAKVIDKFNLDDTSFTTVRAVRPITIRDLLTHTSGIGYAQIGSANANALYAKNNVTAGLAVPNGQLLATAVKTLGTLPLMHQPGQRFTYGLNTDVLGYVIEVVSGMPLDKYFRTQIFDPLGMSDTWFYLPADKQSRLTTLTFEDNTGIHPMTPDFTFNGSKMAPGYPAQAGTYFSGGGGLTSTINDYAIFLQMLLNGGTYNGKRILAPNTVRMMTTNQVGALNLGSDKFGLGFSIATNETAARLPVSVGTFGWGGAFGTAYWVDPKEKIVAQFYTQIWGRRHNVEDNFKVLVYQALNNSAF